MELYHSLTIWFYADKNLRTCLKFYVEKKGYNEKMTWLEIHLNWQSFWSEEWVAKDWNPKALPEGIQHVAFVLPGDVFGQVPVENYIGMNSKTNHLQMSTYLRI